jgi:hypothetical protein
MLISPRNSVHAVDPYDSLQSRPKPVQPDGYRIGPVVECTSSLQQTTDSATHISL